MIAECEYCNTLNNFKKAGLNCISCGALLRFELGTTVNMEMRFGPATTGDVVLRERAKRRWWER